MTQRTTIYLDKKLLQALRMKAIQRNVSLSDMVNESVRYSLREDAVDLQAIRSRTNEPTRSYEAVLKDLKRDRLL